MADSGAFRPVWSERVTAEALRALERVRSDRRDGCGLLEALRALERVHPDIDQSRFQSRFRSMNEAFDDALVQGWESLEPGIHLPDPNDRHTVAAALRGRADVIVTENVFAYPAERVSNRPVVVGGSSVP